MPISGLTAAHFRRAARQGKSNAPLQILRAPAPRPHPHTSNPTIACNMRRVPNARNLRIQSATARRPPLRNPFPAGAPSAIHSAPARDAFVRLRSGRPLRPHDPPQTWVRACAPQTLHRRRGLQALARRLGQLSLKAPSRLSAPSRARCCPRSGFSPSLRKA